jgi:uncharacterized protein YukE
LFSAGSAALHALDSLWSPRPSSSSSQGANTFSTGQSLPTGSAGSAAGSTASGLFGSDALSFLTSLQTVGGAAKSEFQQGVQTLGQDVGGLESAIGQLAQALTSAGSSSSTSSATPTTLASLAISDLSTLASTASAAVGALSTGTPTAQLQALNDLASSLQSIDQLFGGHHHHHHWQGGLASTSDTSSTASTTPSTTTTAGAASSGSGAGA